MVDVNTPFQRLQFKASHNSYARPQDLHEQMHFIAANPANGGCRGLELDIVRHTDGSGGRSLEYFQISHVAGEEGPTLAAYLSFLLNFHHETPQHDPIFVTLDIKSEGGSHTVFPGEIENYLSEWFAPSLIFKPGELLRGPGDLVQNVAAHGWPSLAALRGKFIFCLSGNKRWKSYYADLQPAQRLCFADFDVVDSDTAAKPPQSGNRIIANTNLFRQNRATWRQTVPRFRAANMLVRGYVLNGTQLWSWALEAGVNVLSTDKVSGTSWAKVGTEPYQTG